MVSYIERIIIDDFRYFSMNLSFDPNKPIGGIFPWAVAEQYAFKKISFQQLLNDEFLKVNSHDLDRFLSIEELEKTIKSC